MHKTETIVDGPEAIIAAGYQHGPVLVKRYSRDGFGVSGQNALRSTHSNVPEYDGLIETARCERIGLRIVRHAEDVVVVTHERLDSFSLKGGESTSTRRHSIWFRFQENRPQVERTWLTSHNTTFLSSAPDARYLESEDHEISQIPVECAPASTASHCAVSVRHIRMVLSAAGILGAPEERSAAP